MLENATSSTDACAPQEKATRREAGGPAAGAASAAGREDDRASNQSTEGGEDASPWGELSVFLAMEWESRGTIFGLILDMVVSVTGDAALLVALTFSLRAARDATVPCEVGTSGLEESYEIVLCNYTRVWLYSSPAIASVVLLLQVGRNVLQKRFYYGLLKFGGVLSFSGNKFYTDPLMWLLFITYFHVFGFAALQVLGANRLILSAHDQAPSIASLLQSVLRDRLRPDWGPSGPEPTVHLPDNPTAHASGGRSPPAAFAADQFKMFMVMFGTVTPGCLLLVYSVVRYDIEQTLTPLSEYLSSFEDAESTPELYTFKDTLAKQFVEEEDIAFDEQSTLDTFYRELLDSYRSKRLELLGSRAKKRQILRMGYELHSVGLLKALWPARLLMRSEASAPWARAFQVLWVSATAAVVSWFTFIECYLVNTFRTDVWKAAHGHLDYVLPAIVACMFFLIVVDAIIAFVRTLLVPGIG
mmetsp:Transcript_125839/g.391881  ORF Transcript_125839/g.391881 Transcript_125839/m.391881 type:complete len:472 (-) Transcript_125839:43-1458(-)